MMLLCVLTLSAATYCNPMALENIPVGVWCRDLANGSDPIPLSRTEKTLQYRELADPTLYFENGTMYVFPSGDLCWKSKDRGVTWEHVKVEPRLGIGYAPTVEKFRCKYYLVGSPSPLYVADSIEGPYRKVGEMEIPKGNGAPTLSDPQLFAEGDRLYLYWGCSPKSGIWGAELDSDDPCKLITEPKRLIAFTPETHPWERVPTNPKVGWMEGAWMVKVGDKYHLTYSASGTENDTYAMGDAVGDSPLGPFAKVSSEPFWKKTTGLIRGTGHGSIVKGWDGDYYITYCIAVGVYHGFERFIGFEKIGLDGHGNFKRGEASECPMYADGTPTGWTALATSDGDLRKFQSFEELPAAQQLAFDGEKTVRSFRIIWRDLGLDTRRGIVNGPYRYRVQARTPGGWKVICDAADNDRDLMVDYREVAPTVATAVRLEILSAPKGIVPAVTEFTVFGDGCQSRSKDGAPASDRMQ